MLDAPRRILLRISRLLFHRRYLHSRLSSRITLLFTVSALLLGLTVSTITYYATRSSIVGQYVTAAESTALDNGAIVHDELLNHNAGTLIVNNIDYQTANSSSLLNYRGIWSITGRLSILSEKVLPSSLTDAVGHGKSAEQIFALAPNNVPYIAIGQPINVGSTKAQYFEVFPMSEAQNELQTLLSILLGATALTTVLGVFLGRWAAHRTLRPLDKVSEVARQISDGQLDARIETPRENDLAVITGSFNRMVDLLQDRLVQEERFTSNVSHELRSPLTTLSSSISVLESDTEEMSPRSAQAVSLLSQEIRRFQRMVAELLEISRIDAGSADFQEDEVFIAELVDRSIRRSTSTPPPVEIHPEVLSWTVMADKRRFERIIANLFENAEHYGGGVTRVAISPVTQNRVQIIVEDQGPGVADQDKDRIFDRFARSASIAGQRGIGSGTGLGLALVAEHIRLHHGSIRVEDSEPHGARFIIELPRFIPDDEAVTE